MDERPANPPPQREPPQSPEWPPPADWPPPPPYGTPTGPPPAPSAARSGGGVHPLDVGRAFSLGWSMYRFRWKALLVTLLAVIVPAYALNVLWTLTYGAAVNEWAFAIQPLPGRPPDPLELPPFPTEAFSLFLAVNVLVGLVTIIGMAAAVNILGWTYGGGWTTVGRALRAALARWPTLVGASLLFSLAVFAIIFAGAIAAIAIFAMAGAQGGPAGLVGLIVIVGTVVAVVFVALRWTLFVHVVALEGRGAVEALGRSWRLVSGSTWRVLGYLLLVGLVLMLITIIASFVSLLAFGLGVDLATGRPRPFDPIRAIGEFVIQAAVTMAWVPFYLAVLTLLYYDLRWKRGEELQAPPD